MTRLLLLVLVLANLIAFSAWYGLLETWLPGGSEPERLSGQVAPERLKVLSAGVAAKPAAPQPALDSRLSPAAAAAPSCFEAGPLDDAGAERARAWAKSLPDGLQLALDKRADAASFMVFLPPGASAAQAQRRIEQLRKAGVADLFLIGEGPLRLAVSLGVFRSQEGARSHLDSLVAKGVTGAQIGPVPGRAERSWARLTRGASIADGAWAAARAQLPEIAGSVPAVCPNPGP